MERGEEGECSSTRTFSAKVNAPLPFDVTTPLRTGKLSDPEAMRPSAKTAKREHPLPPFAMHTSRVSSLGSVDAVTVRFSSRV